MLKKLDEVMQSRGKKSTNRKDHVRTLQELYKISDEVSEMRGRDGEGVTIVITEESWIGNARQDSGEHHRISLRIELQDL